MLFGILDQLVPTRVGMILQWSEMLAEMRTCPHTRGDDPLILLAVNNIAPLVPTRVGMILWYYQ